MKVLLLGSGGREHALAWALARSNVVDHIVAAPGNPGIGQLAELLPLDPADTEAVVAAALRIRPGLVVVGPEAPLVAGVGDALRSEGFAVFGPDAAAARIEGSKSFAKELMTSAGIPTGAARTFNDFDDARAYLDVAGPPYVIKADGLAAGKGVVVTSDRTEAEIALRERLVDKMFGTAGTTVVIEEFLDGQEASVIAFSDGKTVLACEPAQDYKRVFDGDAGPNTGGMGSYSPVPACPPDVARQVAEDVIEPMVASSAERGTPFVGALYAGLALTSQGPKVIEFNVRFGDPETQALLPRLATDFGDVCMASAQGELAGMELRWEPGACVTVVLASGGYPGDCATGLRITSLEQAAERDHCFVFHAGTAARDGDLVTSGGRVLAVSALGATLKQARERAYVAADLIDFHGKHVRRDIAERALGTAIPTEVSQ